MLSHIALNGFQQLPGWTDMAPDRTDVGFDDAEGDFHGETPLSEMISTVPASSNN
jgi:hypothetical protein